MNHCLECNNVTVSQVREVGILLLQKPEKLVEKNSRNLERLNR